MNITQNLQKWGNGTGVRLPQKVVKAAKLRINQPLEVSLQGKSIVLTPLDQDKDYTLEKMLEGVTPTKARPLVDWGLDVGAEKLDEYKA